MSLHARNIDWKHVSSYATEANLNKAIAKIADHYPEHHDLTYTIRTPEGRWTVIVKLDMSKGGYIGRYEGFMKM